MSDAPADAITEFSALYAREVEFTIYRVLSTAGDENTAYRVDTKELTCNCPDSEFDKSGAKVCKHLACALYQSRQHIDVELQAVRDLSTQISEMHQAVEDLKQSTTAVKADAKAAASDGSQQHEEGEAESEPFDALEAFEDYLRENGLNPGKIEFHIDDQFGSLQAQKDGYLDDDEFSAWQDITDELGMQWDQDNERNYLKEEDFGVLQ